MSAAQSNKTGITDGGAPNLQDADEPKRLMPASGPHRGSGPRRSFDLNAVLTPDEVREALAIVGDHKWDDVRARIPWSDALGARTLRIPVGPPYRMD